MRRAALLVLVGWLATSAPAATKSELTGEVDLSLLTNGVRSQQVDGDPNLWVFSTLLSLEIERETKAFEAPWTFYVSYQMTALDRFPVDRTGAEFDAYRYWVRHLGRRSEVVLGMQKMVFGHARFLRPLQLFDDLDPNDMTKKTAGTKALQCKVFPRGDVQVFTWLVDNETSSSDMHWGGRVNDVWDGGEWAFTFHRWKPDGSRVGEDVYGLDVFADVDIGLWFEHATHDVVLGSDWNQTTLGMDYTFPRVGYGLHVGLEHMVTSDSGFAELNRTSALFFDTRLNDRDTLFGSYRVDRAFDLRSVNLRVVRDLSGCLNGEVGFDWVNRTIDDFGILGPTLPLRRGVSLRFVYTF